MAEQIINNIFRFSALFLFLTSSALGAKDHWRQVLWQNGIDALAHSEDPYHTLLDITKEIEEEEGVSIEWAFNEIFTKVVTQKQNDRSHEEKPKPKTEPNQKLHEKAKPEEVTVVCNEMPTKKAEEKVQDRGFFTDLFDQTTKPPVKETKKILSNENLINSYSPTPKDEVNVGEKPPSNFGFLKKGSSFPILRSIIDDDDDDDDDDEPDRGAAALTKFMKFPKLLSRGDENSRNSQKTERKVADQANIGKGKSQEKASTDKPDKDNIFDLFPMKDTLGSISKIAGFLNAMDTDKKH